MPRMRDEVPRCRAVPMGRGTAQCQGHPRDHNVRQAVIVVRNPESGVVRVFPQHNFEMNTD